MLARMKNLLSSLLPMIPITAGDIQSYVASTLTVVRWLVVFLLLTNLLLGFAYLAAARKPPLVIRVNDVGHAVAVTDIATNNEVQDVEAYAFTKEFLRSIVEVNSLTIAKDLAHAFNRMTRPYQEAHKRKLMQSNYVAQIRHANVQRSLDLKRLMITAKTSDGFELDVRGLLNTKPLDNMGAPPTRSGMLGQLYLVRVPRTELTPYGVLVSNFQWREVPLEEIVGDEETSLKTQ